MIIKNKAKVYLADILIILFSLATIASLYIFIFSDGFDFDFSQQKNITVKANISKTRDYGVVLKKGDKVYDTDTGKLMGYVESAVYSSDYETIYDSENDVTKNVYHPELVNIDFTINAEYSEKNGFPYKVGEKVSLCSPNLAFDATIYELITIDDNAGDVVDTNDVTDIKITTTEDTEVIQ